MLYLKEDLEAKIKYYKSTYCWISIKLKGKIAASNPDGHICPYSECEICSQDLRKKSINVNFKLVLEEGDNLKKLIIGSPQEILNLNKKIYKRLIVDFGINSNDIINEAKSLFVNSGYKNWFVKRGFNYKLASSLNRNTCTYCNRLYIMTMISEDKEKIMVPQFDHWFSKKKFPLLGLSFYNLIPSCSVCNSSVKGTENLNLRSHLHPYNDKNIAKLFSFSYKKKSFIENNVCFKDEAYLGKKIKNTLSIFKIKKIYNAHSATELRDLLDLKYKYSNNYLDILFNKTFDYKISDSDRYKLLFGVELDEVDFHKRPFSKFKKDILKELKMLK